MSCISHIHWILMLVFCVYFLFYIYFFSFRFVFSLFLKVCEWIMTLFCCLQIPFCFCVNVANGFAHEQMKFFYCLIFTTVAIYTLYCIIYIVSLLFSFIYYDSSHVYYNYLLNVSSFLLHSVFSYCFQRDNNSILTLLFCMYKFWLVFNWIKQSTVSLFSHF